MRRHLTALLVAGLLVAACGDDKDGKDQAAVTSIPEVTSTSLSTTTTESRTVAPDVIPQDESQITEEYVEQVLNELFGVSLQSIGHTRRVGLVDEVTIGLVESINTESQSRETLNGLIDLSARSFEGFRDDPRPATADVSDIIHGDDQCVFAEVRFDSSGLVTAAPSMPENVRGFVRLLPASAEQRESGRNPTAWAIDALPVTEDGTVPEPTCPNV